ncbi:MAG: hypothetical protein QM767_18730 [Anaeromyxobacter sp.]
MRMAEHELLLPPEPAARDVDADGLQAGQLGVAGLGRADQHAQAAGALVHLEGHLGLRLLLEAHGVRGHRLAARGEQDLHRLLRIEPLHGRRVQGDCELGHWTSA